MAESNQPAVLIVDDDRHVSRALSRVLRRFCHVHVASTVDEAEVLIAQHAEFALILCDLLLPERGGLELYHSLVEQQSSLASRMAFMTGLGEDAPEVEGLDEVPCLGKPVDIERVKELLVKPE